VGPGLLWAPVCCEPRSARKSPCLSPARQLASSCGPPARALPGPRAVVGGRGFRDSTLSGLRHCLRLPACAEASTAVLDAAPTHEADTCISGPAGQRDVQVPGMTCLKPATASIGPGGAQPDWPGPASPWPYAPAGCRNALSLRGVGKLLKASSLRVGTIPTRTS
jgi:hypothetical protein